MNKVLIVEDSRLIATLLKDIIDEFNDFKTIKVSKNGLEAIEDIKKYEPDIVLTDIRMPVMDGLELIEKVMKKNPLPIIVVSSFTKKGEDITIEALSKGAVDFIAKPENIFSVKGDEFKKILKFKIDAAINTKIKGKSFKSTTIIDKKHNFNKFGNLKKLVLIGISTGGPRTLQAFLPKIEKDIPATFVIVQHMPKGFTKSLAERLDKLSKIRIKEAEHGEKLKKGYAYIAPGGYHLNIIKRNENMFFDLNKEPPIMGLRPCVDITMKSLVENNIKNIISIIMTGMGSDGTKGSKELKEKNSAYIIAQDEESSVVYGMPRSVKEAGIVDKVVSLKDMANEIMTIMEVH